MAMPLSSITETLFYNCRLLVDSPLYNEDSEMRAWLISKVKRISPNGIAVFTMAQDIFNQHTDYIEKNEDGEIVGMWANYWNSNIEPTSAIIDDVPQSSITSRITCTGKPQFKIGGSAKTFTVTYYDENGEPIPDHETGSWSFTIDDIPVSNSLLTLTQEGFKIKVKFLGDDSYIGKVLTITNTSGNIMSFIDIEILPL